MSLAHVRHHRHIQRELRGKSQQASEPRFCLWIAIHLKPEFHIFSVGKQFLIYKPVTDLLYTMRSADEETVPTEEKYLFLAKKVDNNQSEIQFGILLIWICFV